MLECQVGSGPSRGIRHRLELVVDWLVVGLLGDLGLQVQIVTVVIWLAIAIARAVALISIQAVVDLRYFLGVILSYKCLVYSKNLRLGDAGGAFVRCASRSVTLEQFGFKVG